MNALFGTVSKLSFALLAVQKANSALGQDCADDGHWAGLGGQLYMNELEKLPLPDLDRMIKQVTAAKDTAALYLNALQSTLHSRLGGHAQQLRQQAGKSTGTVRFEVDGYMVVADLPTVVKKCLSGRCPDAMMSQLSKKRGRHDRSHSFQI